VQQTAEKAFPVSWDQFHRDARALAWRLTGLGPFEAIVAITRGGLVAAAIVARELDLRLIETVCVTSYGAENRSSGPENRQGELRVLKGVADSVQASSAVEPKEQERRDNLGSNRLRACPRDQDHGRGRRNRCWMAIFTITIEIFARIEIAGNRA